MAILRHVLRLGNLAGWKLGTGSSQTKWFPVIDFRLKPVEWQADICLVLPAGTGSVHFGGRRRFGVSGIPEIRPQSTLLRWATCTPSVHQHPLKPSNSTGPDERTMIDTTKADSLNQQLNATLLQKVEISPGLAILRVAPENGELAEFSSGQFAVLGLPGAASRCPLSEPEDEPAPSDKLVKRAYSIASSSVARDYIEFYVALVTSGALSPHLLALEPGDRLWLGPKVSGMFTLDQVPEDKSLLLMATGTGLAPYMSMLRSNFECARGRHVAVIHGARHSWELGYRSELLMLANMCPNFTYLPIISRPQNEHVPWGGQTGYVQDVWESGILDEKMGVAPTPENAHVFLCGNPAMVETMAEELAERGFDEHSKRSPGQLHLERYW